MNPRFTVSDLAEKFNVDKEDVRGLVRFCVALGLATQRGKRKPVSGRGRPEAIYSFVDGYEGMLAAKLKRAKLT